VGVVIPASPLRSSTFPHVPAHLVARAGSGAVYRRREPTVTTLYPIVQHHLESFLARADVRGDVVPHWIDDDVRAYLACGRRQSAPSARSSLSSVLPRAACSAGTSPIS
jgi:hypothetical protein